MGHDLDKFFSQTDEVAFKDRNPFRVPVKQQLAILAAILFLLFAGATSTFIASLTTTPNDANALGESWTPKTDTATATVLDNVPPLTFADTNISAESAYVLDVSTGKVLFKKNSSDVLPLASVTKLMTALLVDEILSTDANISISENSLNQYGNSGLLENETFSRQELMDLVLMSSSNDGAYALAAEAGKRLDSRDPLNAFIIAMNARAEELGMSHTTFRNATGLDISETVSGADGTAEDIAVLLQYIVTHNPDLLAATIEPTIAITSEDGFAHNGQNTNYYLDEIPGIIGSKTGYTTLAGGNLAVAFNAGLDHPVVVVVLGSTRQARFTDVVSLANAAQNSITSSAASE